jgi:hypothetical protein
MHIDETRIFLSFKRDKMRAEDDISSGVDELKVDSLDFFAF